MASYCSTGAASSARSSRHPCGTKTPNWTAMRHPPSHLASSDTSSQRLSRSIGQRGRRAGNQRLGGLWRFGALDGFDTLGSRREIVVRADLGRDVPDQTREVAAIDPRHREGTVLVAPGVVAGGEIA